MSNTLITGASAGIGADLARVFATNGHNLILVARSTDKMQAVAQPLIDQFGTNVEIISQDLSTPEAAKELFQKVQERNLTIDNLVNNAGMGALGLYHKISWSKLNQMLQLNIMVLSELCHLFLPQLIEAKNGRILNVASTAAFQAGPYMSTYFASKSYVLSLSEGLNEEYRKLGVSISVLCPGATQTEFFEKADMETSVFFKYFKKMTSLKVAQVGYKGLVNNKVVIIPGLLNWLGSWLVGLTPRFVTRRLMGLFLKDS